MRRIFWGIVLLAFPCLLLLAGVLGWRFYRALESEVLARFSSHQWELPSKLYAEATLLYPGMDIVELGLLDRLAHLDYRPVGGTVQARGEYRYEPQRGVLQIFLRDAPFPSRAPRPQRVELALRDGRIERLTDLDEGTELPAVEIEPEVITGLYDQAWEERRLIKLYDVPSLLVKALLAAED
ncbi:MAG: hypothetical protein HYZ72_03230, partial [Deltaproteobacteria bacterium]|nr:hypothetical protein [Deltaproteobacteria bacterium]